MTWHIVRRLRYARLLQDVVIAVPASRPNKPIRTMAEDSSIPYFAGSETDLIDRIYKTAVQFQADAIVRITGDCPLVDPDTVDRVARTYLDGFAQLDYVSNLRPRTFPHGLDAEVYSLAILEKLWHEIEDPFYREWFPLYVWEHEPEYRTSNVTFPQDVSHLRWTVDYQEDLIFVREVYRRLYREGRFFGMDDVLSLLATEPQLSLINAKVRSQQNSSPFGLLPRDAEKG